MLYRGNSFPSDLSMSTNIRKLPSSSLRWVMNILCMTIVLIVMLLMPGASMDAETTLQASTKSEPSRPSPPPVSQTEQTPEMVPAAVDLNDYGIWDPAPYTPYYGGYGGGRIPHGKV